MALFECKNQSDGFPDMSGSYPVDVYNNRATFTTSQLKFVGNKIYINVEGTVNFSTERPDTDTVDWTIGFSHYVAPTITDLTGATIHVLENTFVKQTNGDNQTWGLSIKKDKNIVFLVRGTMNVNTHVKFKCIIDLSTM